MAFIETSKAGRPLYIVRWNYRDKTIDGKPYDEKSFRRLDQANAWHRKVNRSPGITPGRARWSHIIELWLEQHVSQLPLSTRADYDQAARMRMIPGFGTKIADRFTPLEASTWVRAVHATGFDHLDRKGRRRKGQPASAPTTNKTLRIAKAMVRWARAEGLTTSTAFDDVRSIRDRRPREERRSPPHAYTVDERARIVQGCDTMLMATLVRLGADSGLRRGELLALRWEHVDLDGGLVHVRKTLDKDGSEKDPKTYERRTVPVLADGLEALTAWREHAPRTELVFPAADGGTLHTKIKRRIEAVRAKSGIHLQLHELRDTYASALIAAGASDMELAIAGGWRSVQTVRDHYAEWLEPSREDLRQRANARLLELRSRAGA